MPVFSASRSRFTLADTGGVARDISPQIKRIQGLPGRRGMEDVTALASTGRQYAPGPRSGKFTITGNFDNTDANSADNLFNALLNHNAAVAFRYGPGGLGRGAYYYYGNAWVETYDVGSVEGRYVSFVAELLIEGVLNRGRIA